MAKLLRIPEVARRLGLSDNKVYDMAAKGAIPAFKIGGNSWRVREEALEAWLLQQSAAAEAKAGL